MFRNNICLEQQEKNKNICILKEGMYIYLCGVCIC